MALTKYLSPNAYIEAVRFRYKKFKRQQRLQNFANGGISAEDKTNAYHLFLSMEHPWEQRPSEVLDYITKTGKRKISLKHQYFQNTEIDIDLLDNFQVSISQEFFIDNVYDLNKVKFEPELVVDCGGYKGYFTWLAIAKYKTAKFICVEAHPTNYGDILNTANKNSIKNVEIIHAAISKSEQAVEFFFEGTSGSMENTFSYESKKVVVETIDLQKLISGYDSVLLKIDIEGAELEYLPKIIKSLPAQCAVFFETHDYWNSLDKIKNQFIDNGFSFEVIREKNQFIDSFAQRK